MVTNTVTSFKSAFYTTTLVARKMFRSFEMSSTRISNVSTFSRLVFISKSRYRSHSHHRLFHTSKDYMSLITPKERLNITIHRSSLITPLKETTKRTMFLSNMDLILNLRVGSIFFFSNHLNFPIESVVQMVETAFKKILVTYDYVAGRLKPDQEGRLQIDCNSAGVGFVVASSDLTLEALGDLASSNPKYQKLAVRQFEGSRVNEQPLLNLQITSFKCGAFSLGFSFNHIIFDGIGYKGFLENLASLTRNQPLYLTPVSNRELLSPRYPPQPTFPHPEFIKLNSSLKGYNQILSPILPSINTKQTKTFHLSATDILNLKDKAKMDDEGNNNIHMKVTDFDVVLTHIWRCIGLTKNTGHESEIPFSIIYAYNFRHKLRPMLPSSYTGNATYFVPSTTTFNELEVGPFSRLVQMITLTKTHFTTDEYIRSAIDCIELHSGYVFADVVVTSWWKLGFLDTMYPWGKPKWNCPVLENQVNSMVYILPDIEGTSSTHGCNITVSLQPKEMEKFQGFFDRFLGRI